jgi:hypothetical protein
MQCLILTVIGTLKIMFPVTKHILQMFALWNMDFETKLNSEQRKTVLLSYTCVKN